VWEDALASSPEPPHSQGRGAQAQRRYVAAYPPVFLLTTSRGIQTRCRRDKACQGVTPHANGGPTSLRTTHANAVQVRSLAFFFFFVLKIAPPQSNANAAKRPTQNPHMQTGGPRAPHFCGRGTQTHRSVGTSRPLFFFSFSHHSPTCALTQPPCDTSTRPHTYTTTIWACATMTTPWGLCFKGSATQPLYGLQAGNVLPLFLIFLFSHFLHFLMKCGTNA